MAFENPFMRLSDEQIERALDRALAENDNSSVHQIVYEIERRGQQLTV
jgi:transcriptional/translational regulatory protein YebC/TACO1